MQSVFFVYILRCADGSFYVGSHRGTDINVRVAEHNAGKHSNAWTFKRRPVELVWSDNWPEAEPAIAAEQQIKKWSRAKKEALIRGDIGELKRLARSRSAPPDPKKKKRPS